MLSSHEDDLAAVNAVVDAAVAIGPEAVPPYRDNATAVLVGIPAPAHK